MNDFDQKAGQWDKNPSNLDRTATVAGEMVQRLRFTPGMRALEFGAGTGLLSFILKDRFDRITLMDTSAGMLGIAREKLASDDQGKINTLLFDLEKEDYAGDPFDIIFTQMVMHHMKDVPAIVGKFYEMTAPGGVIAIADLHAEDGSFHDGSTDVHHGFDPAALSSLLEETGFTGIQCSTCFVIRKEAAAGTREYPVFLLTAVKE